MKSLICGIAGLSLLLLASCGNYVYKSPNAHVPLFQNQHDINAQLNIGGAGTEIYAAYAPLPFLGFGVGYSSLTNKNDSTSQSNVNHNYRFNEFEASVVPFYKVDDLVTLECPTGLGIPKYTSLNNSFSTYQPYQRYFTQPTVGLHFKGIDLAVLVRVSQLDYTRFGTDIRYEPGVMFRGGSKYVKAMAQFRLEYGTQDQNVDYWPFHIGFGVNFSINPKEVKTNKAAK